MLAQMFRIIKFVKRGILAKNVDHDKYLNSAGVNAYAIDDADGK
jgi:hypothetical protein